MQTIVALWDLPEASFLAVLADVALKCCLLLAAAAAVCLLLRRASASARHAVWLAALSAVIAMPALALALPGWRVLPHWTTMSGSPSGRVDAQPKDVAALPIAPRVLAASAAPDAATRRRPKRAVSAVPVVHELQRSTAGWRVNATGIVLTVWLVGAVLLLIPLLRGAWALRRLSRAATEVAGGPLADTTANVARQLRIRPPRLLLGPPGAMPRVWGVFRAHLLLPREAAEWTAAQLRCVLLHELAHLARRDPAALVVGQLARAMHWYSPLAWYGVRRLRVERERACDDFVIRDGVKPSDYAQQVLNLAATLSPVPCPASAAMAQRAGIEARLRTILESGRDRRTISRRQIAVLLLATCAAAGSLSVLRAGEQPSRNPAQPPERVLAVVGDPAPPDEQPQPQDKQPEDPADEQPAASQGPVVLGLDLSTAVNKKSNKELTDLYEPNPERPGRLRVRRDVFPLPLKGDAGITEPKSAWLKFPVSKGRFYIEYRSDRRQPETERLYGPFDGDPFDRFELEQAMAQRLQTDYSPDDIYRIKLMLRTGDAGMARRAVRLMRAALEVKDMPTKLETYPASFRQVLEDFDATIEKHASEAAADLRGALEIAAGELERLTKEFPESEYQHADAAATKPPAKIPREAWGEAADGLRLAAVPDNDTLRPGQAATYSLVAENVGQQVIKFSVSDLLQSAQAEVRRLDGGQVETRRSWFSGVSPTKRFWLKPGEQMVLAQPSVGFIEKAGDAENAFGRTQAITGPIENRGIYLVSLRVYLSGGSGWSRDANDGVMYRVMPAKGEWTGVVTSGAVAVGVSKE